MEELTEKVRMMKVILSIYNQLSGDNDGTVTIVGTDVQDLRELLSIWLDNRNEELS